MGSSAPTPPPAPDPYATASAQATANAGTATANALLNNPNIISPYGTQTQTQTGTQQFTNPDGSTYNLPTFTETQTLSAAQQNLLNQNNALASQQNVIAKGALNNVAGVLSNPVNQSDLANLQMYAGQNPTLQTSFNQGNALQSTYNAGGTVQSGYNTGGPITTSYDQGGPIQNSVGYSLAGTDAHQNANAPTTFAQTANQVQGSLGSNDYSGQANALTNSVLARLAPTIAAQQDSLNANLANQGTAQGSSAYNAAQLQQNQSNNDLYLGAIGTGDQEQQQLFNENATAGQFANAAQEQEYEQALGRGQFTQAGIAQNNAANLNEAQYGLAATTANNTAQLNAGNFANAAQAQKYGENAATAAFSNAAQSQQYQENAALAAFGNSAQAQQNQENQAAAGFYNQTAAQQYAQNQSAATFANQAATQQYQNQIAGKTFDNQAAQQQYSQALGLQNNYINEISGLRSGGQVTSPGMTPYNQSQVDQTPLSADVYATAGLNEQTYMAQSQAAAQNNAALYGMFGSLAGGFGKMIPSDRRLKQDIEPIATARNGLPIYLFRYRGDAAWHLGLMSDDVRKVHPEAVVVHPSGFDTVDYDKAVA